MEITLTIITDSIKDVTEAAYLIRQTGNRLLMLAKPHVSVKAMSGSMLKTDELGPIMPPEDVNFFLQIE